jgi:hypothetical protein
MQKYSETFSARKFIAEINKHPATWHTSKDSYNTTGE